MDYNSYSYMSEIGWLLIMFSLIYNLIAVRKYVLYDTVFF